MSKGSKVVFVAYVHNTDTFNAMSKGYRYIQCYVKRVKRLCYVETRDKHVFAHNFLNIQAIFNPKKVLERPFQTIPSNAMYVEGVESYFDFRPL